MHASCVHSAAIGDGIFSAAAASVWNSFPESARTGIAVIASFPQ